jgi:hypothetical protein
MFIYDFKYNAECFMALSAYAGRLYVRNAGKSISSDSIKLPALAALVTVRTRTRAKFIFLTMQNSVIKNV